MSLKSVINVEYVANSANNSGYGGLNSYATNLFNELSANKELNIVKQQTKQILGLTVALSKNIRSENNLLHFTNQELLSPLVARKKFVVTVHDLTVKKFSLFKKSRSQFSFFGEKIYNYKLSALKSSKYIIAISNNTKQDLINDLGIKEDKIFVTYEGVNSSFKPLNIEKSKNKLLYVGNEMPHKNLPALLKAIAIAKKIIPDLKLTKIGSSGWKGSRDALIELCQKLGIKDSVEFKDNVVDLIQEYNSAEALIFPSLYEGFGLPILEAMACGCPVISSNSSSLTEVGGNASLYFNPADSCEIAEKIIKLLSDNRLKFDLVKKGLEQSKKFSWQKCAKETAEVYKKCLN